MAGTTAIDTDLRDELLNYLGFVLMDTDKRGIHANEKIAADAKDLFYRLKPQRTRARKVFEVSPELEKAITDIHTASDIQPSQ